MNDFAEENIEFTLALKKNIELEKKKECLNTHVAINLLSICLRIKTVKLVKIAKKWRKFKIMRDKINDFTVEELKIIQNSIKRYFGKYSYEHWHDSDKLLLSKIENIINDNCIKETNEVNYYDNLMQRVKDINKEINSSPSASMNCLWEDYGDGGGIYFYRIQQEKNEIMKIIRKHNRYNFDKVNGIMASQQNSANKLLNEDMVGEHK